MVELKAKSPCADLLPLDIGGVLLREMVVGPMAIIAPFAGREADVAAVLGADWPAPGQVTHAVGTQLIWFGRGQALWLGDVPGGLEGKAAVTDQCDGWACVELRGAGAVDVLARLVPVDLRVSDFGAGQTRRTMLGHMHVSITGLETGGFMILAFRSMAATLVHDLEGAMQNVAARQ